MSGVRQYALRSSAALCGVLAMLTLASLDGVAEPKRSLDPTASLSELARRFPAPAYPTHDGESVVAQDLNQDGIIDVAWGDLDQEGDLGFGAVEVRLGRGDGTLGPKAVFSTEGTGTFAITAADLDGDGFPDLAAANTSTHDVSVLLGNGDGTFGPPSLYPVGGSPRSIDAGHLDADDHIDLVTGNRNSHDLTLLFGRGDGTFEEGVFVSSGGFAPHDVAIADMNADGHSDLISANTGSRDIAVLLNAGDRSFEIPRVFDADSARKMAVADFTGDGFPDVASSEPGSEVLNVLVGDGLGGLGDAMRVSTGTALWALESADLDGDGWLDLVGAFGSAQVFLGRGGGQFEPGPVFDVGETIALALADLDADGAPDLITSRGLVARGLGDGSFDLAPRFAPGVPSPLHVVDLDADGFDDLLGFLRAPALVVLRGRGDGSFEPQRRIDLLPQEAEPPFVFFLAVPADLDRDGLLDIVGLAKPGGPFLPDTVLVLLGRGSFRFEVATQLHFKSLNAGFPIVADFNGDRILDVVMGAKTFLGIGDGGLIEKPRDPQLISPPAATADVNGDGHIDVVSSLSSSSLELRLGRGDGTFTERELLSFPHARPQDVFLEDIDGDAFLDIILADGFRVRVAPGNGDGTFREEIQTPISHHSHQAMALGDIDGDGRLDAVAAIKPGTVAVLLGNGDGTFREPQQFGAGREPQDVALADLDRDCRLDILVGNRLSGDVAVLLARPGAPLCAGDCDGDAAVSEEEIRRAIGLIFDADSRCSCPPLDTDGDRTVRANDLLGAVGARADCDAMTEP